MRTGRALGRGCRRAFTLVELLIVIGIIVLLIAIAATVGSSVLSGGKAEATRNTMRVLETMLNDSTQQEGKIPAPTVADPRDQRKLLAIADARNMDASSARGSQMINSVGLFILQSTGGDPTPLRGVSNKFLKPYTAYDASGAAPADAVPEMPTILDPWGRPVRYVHPTFHGEFFGPDVLNPSDPRTGVLVTDLTRDGTPAASYAYTVVRRNSVKTATPPATGDDEADSDGGLCPGGQPYFYSAGPDGDPSTIDDNVYTIEPKYLKE